jgi:formamidopyrimidine-DNA glycosylase
MPELPEVERGRLVLEAMARGRRIEAVACADDRIVFDRQSPLAVKRALVGRRAVAACRRGKHLWLELDRPPFPCFHFGMTGSFQGYHDESERPRFWKIELTLDHGLRLAMTDARRFGRIRLARDPLAEEPIRSLGFDPHLDLPGPAEFLRLCRGRTVTAKGLLLDQSFAAGVGNWIADEILYQAGIDPRARVADLSDADLRSMRTRLKAIIDLAVREKSQSSRYPRSWLFHYRWGKPKGAVDARGEAISFATVAGRTTAWVPARQPIGARRGRKAGKG